PSGRCSSGSDKTMLHLLLLLLCLSASSLTLICGGPAKTEKKLTKSMLGTSTAPQQAPPAPPGSSGSQGGGAQSD
ncbi:hypothetical protein PMAYCL1PPCAC_25885, partial [Pristionchus mayeri]